MTNAEPRTETTETAESTETFEAPEEANPVTAESLIEEVSIDGMCGVY